MDKYSVYCQVEKLWKQVISSTEPTQCPDNAGHLISMPHIIKENILINDGTPKEVTLADYKQLRYNEIDGKTVSLITHFDFDSRQFSLSLAAQSNWTNIKSNTSNFTFPLEITCINNDSYDLAEVDVTAFWTAARDVVKTHMDSGRALKKSIFDAVDEAAVDAIIDNR